MNLRSCRIEISTISLGSQFGDKIVPNFQGCNRETSLQYFTTKQMLKLQIIACQMQSNTAPYVLTHMRDSF